MSSRLSVSFIILRLIVTIYIESIQQVKKQKKPVTVGRRRRDSSNSEGNMSTQSGTDGADDTFELVKKKTEQSLAKSKEYSELQGRAFVSKDLRKVGLMQAYEKSENEDMLHIKDFRL